MPQTPSSSANSYATVEDFKSAYDLRILGILPDDTNTPIDPDDLPDNQYIKDKLAAASGLVEAAALNGAKYTAEDLQALTGNARALLVQIVCDIAYEMLRRRRGVPEPPLPAYVEAMRILDAIRDGEKIFPTVEAANASLPTNRFLTQADLDRPRLASRLLRRTFGVRIRDMHPYS
jgi:phage gp36-like protein